MDDITRWVREDRWPFPPGWTEAVGGPGWTEAVGGPGWTEAVDGPAMAKRRRSNTGSCKWIREARAGGRGGGGQPA